MESSIESYLTRVVVPGGDSHKGQNGRLLLIGGSALFHAASLWSLTIASRIVDLVHYASTIENNSLLLGLKAEFRNGMVVPRNEIGAYIDEDDAILIGPGLVRTQLSSFVKISALSELSGIQEEGVLTAALTKYLLTTYPHKQWIIDAGALQMLDVSDIPRHAILTPHTKEFDILWEKHCIRTKRHEDMQLEDKVRVFAREYSCILVTKGKIDIVCDSDGTCINVHGGNAGMTKGGTGDVLSGLIAALACKSSPFVAAVAGSYLNKKAGDTLYAKVGPFFNASDLADMIPGTMKDTLHL